MMNLRLTLASLSLVLSLAPAVARADVSDADRATARALAVEGQEALNRKDFAAALDRFQRADALIHAPTLLLGVARAHAGLGRLIAAQEAYSRVVREGVPAGSPEPFFVALEDARKELDALVPRIPSVTVEVKGHPAPNVTIDGAEVPQAALGAKRLTDPGAHVIQASAPGYAPAEAKVTLAEGAHERVALELLPAAEAAGPSPVTPVDGGGGPSRTTLGIVALGVGGAGLALGAVTGFLAIGKHSDLEGMCTDGFCPNSAQADLDSYHTLGLLSTIGFIVGGAGVAGGAILILTAPDSPPSTGQAWIAPQVGVGYVGATGRF